MLRLAVILGYLMAHPVGAEQTVFAAPGTESSRLVIYSSLDTPQAAHLIGAFQAAHPDTAVVYEDLLTGEIAARVTVETAENRPTADLVFLSAMDLAVKLANDGLARAVEVPLADQWPRWANWRNTAYAVTVEPGVFVYHRPSFPDGPPDTRAGLIRWLADAPPGRIGTYDIGQSAVGFLLHARDREHFFDIGDLNTAMGAAGVQLFPTSQQVIDRVATGELIFGYNVLRSYAADQSARMPDLGVVPPRDFMVLVSRVALIPRTAANPDGGTDFLAFLMSADGQRLLSDRLRLPAVNPAVTGPGSLAALQQAEGAVLRPVPVGPGLLAYLDQASRARILATWQEQVRP
jgi:iron(III) transport system substrate-binding protein